MRAGGTKLVQGDGWILTLLYLAGAGIALTVVGAAKLASWVW